MKSLRLYIILASALVVVYIIALYNQPKQLDWTQSLNKADKIPFGTYVLYHQLNDIFPGAKVEVFREPVYNVITDHNLKKGTYLIVCDGINLTEYDYDKLKQYIKNGNDVFIAASYFGEQFKKELKIETQTEFGDDTDIKIKIRNKYLDTNKLYSVKRGMSDGYFKQIDSSKAIILGTNTRQHFNFIKYSIGKGNLYLNTMPLMFTNYSLLDTVGVNYASTALSHLKNDSRLIWDEYYTIGREDDGSSMRVFLRNPSLKWAFYLSFFGLIIFILYEMKRRQRIIPIIEPLRNTTIDFVNVVGQVYYEQRNNKDIAEKKASYFLEHVRNKYQLKTNVLDDAFIASLANKSGADEKLVHDLTNQIIRVRVQSVYTDAELIAFNKNIEQFNIQSR